MCSSDLNKDNDCDGQIDDDCLLPAACTGAEASIAAGCFEECTGSHGLTYQNCGVACATGRVSTGCNSALANLLNCYVNRYCPTVSLDEDCAREWCPLQAAAALGIPECDYGDSKECGASNVGACVMGQRACDAGRWSTSCVGAIGPGPEICGNGIDEDCDGSTLDQDLEICDGQDNDCDGNADDGCFLPPGPPCPEDKAAFDACVTGCNEDDWCVFECLGVLSQECQDRAGNQASALSDCATDIFYTYGYLPYSCFTADYFCKNAYDALFSGTPGACVHGTVVSGCGPAAETGACQFGTKTCAFGVWGSCEGAVFPQPEACGDGIDNDCDGVADEQALVYLDNDGDGVGGGEAQLVCPEAGWAVQGVDCDDLIPAIFPGRIEDLCNSKDDDCDPATLDYSDVDADADGYSYCEDRNDANASSYPGAPELCDGLDNDGDGYEDEGCSSCGNGSVTGSEACDDGAALDGDGCSSLCAVEPGYQCSGQPSVCSLL